ncbi:conserved hypothetical protein [Ricinus communis]|uniref:Uncharacterized protein n=1 Tax=Ricinus communis TaxID=3988 RepID=B9RU51_RICCO|nr:conserved hypothetical protein [Ricinus communis]
MGRTLVTRGPKWRGWLGNDVCVYDDNWIDRPFAFKVLSPSSLPLHSQISCLPLDNGSWNETLIRRYFLHFEAEDILNMTCPRFRHEELVAALEFGSVIATTTLRDVRWSLPVRDC